ncbi:hypothetical protein ACMFMF_011278 [Clarireedia jacksonii]
MSTTKPTHPRYRPACQITEEISRHAEVYFDEQMYMQGLNLLSNVFTAGISHPITASTPACVPSPKYLQIASTLLVHPLHTSHASNKERLEMGSRSISLLRSVLQDVGPRAAHLEQAFAFPTCTTTMGRNTRRGRIVIESHDGESNSDEEIQGDGIKGAVSQQGVFRRAKDFWHIVGWAFNCSVRYPKRWRYWKVLLEYLLEVLDDDWNEREAMDDEEHQEKRQAELLSKSQENHRTNVEPDLNGDELFREHRMLRDSLLIRYLNGFDYKYSSAPLRRIVKAAFADGSAQSLKEFPEIFENETKEMKKKSTQKRKRDEKIDVTTDMEFGDYDEENDDRDTLFETMDGSPSPDFKAKTVGTTTYASTIGGSDAIVLRQKVMTLLSRASFYLPDLFIPISNLYTQFRDQIAPLPLPSFSAMLSPSNRMPFPSALLVSLIQLLTFHYLPSTTPRPQSENDTITQEILETYFLPHCPMTSSIEDNAKYSILAESLFRVFLLECNLSHTPQLEEAVRDGIRARESNCLGGRRRRGSDGGDSTAKREEVAKLFFQASSRRLTSLINWWKVKSAQESDKEFKSL